MDAVRPTSEFPRRARARRRRQPAACCELGLASSCALWSPVKPHGLRRPDLSPGGARTDAHHLATVPRLLAPLPEAVRLAQGAGPGAAAPRLEAAPRRGLHGARARAARPGLAAGRHLGPDRVPAGAR